MILTKQTSRTDLIKQYVDIELESQKQSIRGQKVYSSFNSYNKNWEHQLKYLKKDYSDCTQNRLRNMIIKQQGELNTLKRSQSVQSSIKYLKNMNDKDQNNFEYNHNLKCFKNKNNNSEIEQQPQILQKQQSKEQKHINTYVNKITEQSEKRYQQRASSAQCNRQNIQESQQYDRNNRKFTPEKILPEWKSTYSRSQQTRSQPITSSQSLNKSSTTHSTKSYNINENFNKDQINIYNPRIFVESQNKPFIQNSQQNKQYNQKIENTQPFIQDAQQYQQSNIIYKNNIQNNQQKTDTFKRCSSTGIIKRKNVNLLIYKQQQQPDSFRVSTKQVFQYNQQYPTASFEIQPDDNYEQQQQTIDSSQYEQLKYQQMKDYIFNSFCFKQQIPSKQLSSNLNFQVKPIEQKINTQINANKFIQESNNQRQNYQQQNSMSYCRNINLGKNQNPHNIRQVVQQEKYDMMMSHINQYNQQNKKIYKNIFNNSQQKMNTQPSQPFSKYDYTNQNEILKLSYRSTSSQRNKRKIFEDDYAINIKDFDSQYNQMFGRAHTEQ